MPSKYTYCIHVGCQKRAYYNYPLLRPSYCLTHKLEGMSSRIHAICVYPDCDVIASFNYPGQRKLLYCAHHKLPEMVNLKVMKCGYLNCNLFGSYCYLKLRHYSDIDYRCAKHKLDHMVKVKNMTIQQQDSRKQSRINLDLILEKI